jgi:pimeloyl-ACP methyl ester carboxylesterase
MDPTPFHRGGSGEPLLLIHGFSGTWRNWIPVLPALERRHDVLAVGLAGHWGCAALPEDAEVGVPALADAIERDMDAAGFGTAHLVGNSLGGWLALELATRGRARSVVALSPAGGWEGGRLETLRLRLLFDLMQRTSRQGAGAMASLFARSRFRRLALLRVLEHGDRVPPAEALAMARGSAECPIYWDLFEAIERHGPPDALEGIDVPVVIAWGTKDRIIPDKPYSARLRRLLPDADWRALPGLGHVPMYDDPESIARLILEATETAGERPAAGAAA